MRKIRFISIALVTSLMLMGAGYASWADNLVINNTVATGELNVNFVNDDTRLPACGAEYVIPSVQIVDEKAHTVQVSLTNLYPGAWAAFRVKGINSGTIPVKLDGFQVDFNGDKELLPYLTYEAGLTIDTNGDNEIDYKIGKFSGKLEDIATDFNTKINLLNNEGIDPLKDARLEAYGKGNFCLNIPEKDAVDLDRDGSKEQYIIIHFNKHVNKHVNKHDSEEITEKKTLTFTFTTKFKQFNQ